MKSHNAHEIEKLIKIYSELDCLLLDEMTSSWSGGIRNILGNALYKILLRLKEAQKLVVFTSDISWHEIENPNVKRFLSLASCKEVAITKPDFTLRKELAIHFSSQSGFPFEDEIITFIAKQEAESVREIEALINVIYCRAKFLKQKINLSFVESVYLERYKAVGLT